MNLQEIRQKYPQYASISDQELAQRLYQKHYSSRMSFDDFSSRIGYQPQQVSEELPQQPAVESVVSRPDLPKGTVLDQIAAPLKAFAGSAIGSSLGGLKGIWELIESGDLDSAVNAIRSEQKRWEAEPPTTQEGQRGMQILQNTLSDIEKAYNFAAGGAAGLVNVALQPYSNITQGFEPAKQEVRAIREQGLGRALGEEALQRTGSPFLATMAELSPSIAESAAGFYGSRAARGAGQITDTAEDALVASAKAKKVPLLTSDAFPPDSYIGRWTQRLSEKLGPLGSGSARQAQQVARQDVVANLADEFGVSIDAPFFDQIVRSLSAENARALESGMRMRRSAIDSLKDAGNVTTSKVDDALDSIIARQQKLKGAARQDVTDAAQRYAEASRGQNFENLAAVRTELIREIKDLEGSVTESKSSKLSALRSIKSAIDEDMQSFAKATDRQAASEWVRSTRFLADQIGRVKNSELKRMIERGEVTPEIVGNILRGGKRSELTRLYRSLDADGRQAARAAVIRDALDKSGFFSGDPNPNRFATEMGKTRTQQAVDVLFDEKGKAELRGMQRLIDATRRAQDAALTTETGAQLVLPTATGAFGAGLATSPEATLALTSALVTVAKTYESAAFRNLLLRLNRTKKGSSQERKVLDKLVLSATYGTQAAKAGQEEKEQKE